MRKTTLLVPIFGCLWPQRRGADAYVQRRGSCRHDSSPRSSILIMKMEAFTVQVAKTQMHESLRMRSAWWQWKPVAPMKLHVRNMKCVPLPETDQNAFAVQKVYLRTNK